MEFAGGGVEGTLLLLRAVMKQRASVLVTSKNSIFMITHHQ